ncbi:c-type cytochrome [Pelagibacterium sp.]|uniref:c-type cytochrome n=1 Tax=Pelagibacterium sp. TaxID=1967288 RepID=UPI003A8F9684
MNSFELNKIFGAILGTLVFVMGVGFIADEIYAPIEGRGADYALPEPAPEGGEGGQEAPGVPSIAARMQTASAEEGANLINRCQSCHDYSPANENRTGPGIYGVVGHPIASHEGFAYSDALATLGANGEVWDYEHLDAFLESPRNYAPGTKMSFAGLSNPEDRANLIAFLRENSDDPFPLPEAPAEEEVTPAEGESGEDAPVEDELTAALAAVTPEQGEALIVRCQSCHDYSPANANRVGPGIHNVVGADIALHEGYSYSDALASLGAEGETWTPENLSAFLEDPADFAPGTRMSFPGLADIEDRAALIVFLNSISDNPIDLTGGAASEGDAAAEQPVLDEVEALNLEESAEGDDPVVIDAEEPQVNPTPQTEDAAPGEGQPAGETDEGGAELDNAPETTAN